jgi:hypothetical protein
MKHLDNDFEVVGPDNGIYLESPNGTKYQVTVDDSGVLSVVKPAPPVIPITGFSSTAMDAVMHCPTCAGGMYFTGEITDLFVPAGAVPPDLATLKADPVVGDAAYAAITSGAQGIWPIGLMVGMAYPRWIVLGDGSKASYNRGTNEWQAGPAGTGTPP